MNEFLIVVGLASFLLLSILRPRYGVYLIVLLLPSYQIRFALAGVPMTFLEGMILILAAVTLQDVTRFKKINIRELLPIGLFLLAALMSIFFAPDKIKAAGIFKAYFFEPVLFYFLVRVLIDTREKLRRLYDTLALLVLYLSIFGLYQFLTLQSLPVSWWAVGVAGRRITSLLNHPNALTLLLGPLVALLIFQPQKSKLHFAAIAAGGASIYLTLSRAGWLALGAVVAGFGFFTEHRKKVVAGALVALCLMLLVPFSRQKLLDLAGGADPTQENRYLLWSAGLDLIKQHPLTGVGLMGFHEEFKNYPIGPDRVVQNYPHNFFLNFWVETGLLGLISMICLLIIFYKKSRHRLPVAAAMTVILLHGLVDVPYFKNDLSVLFWLLLALPDLPGLD